MTDLQNTHSKKYGPGAYKCRKCNNHHGVIRKYNLMMCRRCFREKAAEIGFTKVSELLATLVWLGINSPSFPFTVLNELQQSSCQCGFGSRKRVRSKASAVLRTTTVFMHPAAYSWFIIISTKYYVISPLVFFAFCADIVRAAPRRTHAPPNFCYN
jgi:small subunit ribosomal protein S29e